MRARGEHARARTVHCRIEAMLFLRAVNGSMLACLGPVTQGVVWAPSTEAAKLGCLFSERRLYCPMSCMKL